MKTLHMHETITLENKMRLTAVPGGWIYERVAYFYNDDDQPSTISVSMCFVPDPTAPHVKGGKHYKSKLKLLDSE
jgi:hypothetical protein